ncbi:hypothetical protein AVEN_229559-1 [Araneus ventricosus]|uniref:Uncharacterized protein n=1 Tax=Araneus ventricosus TaxID=182803 RepID=A0A4Y2VIW3_ARAVE|nr:hypothetical protein AVEN_229559-1 [Araneus ventricosus]
MSTYSLDAHQSRRTQHRADFAEEKIWLSHSYDHGCLSRAFILSTQIPPKFTGRPLTTSLEVPEPEKQKRPPSSLKFSPRKNQNSNPVCPPPPTKKARFPTSQAVTSLPSRTFSKV